MVEHVTYERPELFLLGLPLLGVGLEQVSRPDSLHLLHLNLLTRDSVIHVGISTQFCELLPLYCHLLSCSPPPSPPPSHLPKVKRTEYTDSVSLGGVE
jgi:hypothetical protein